MEHGAITDGESCVGCWVVEDCLALLGSPVVNQPHVSRVLGHREYTVALLKCAGDSLFNKMQEGLDGGQPRVARTRCLASHPLQGLQERKHPGGVKVCKWQGRRWDEALLTGDVEPPLEGRRGGSTGMQARRPLHGKPLPQRGGQRWRNLRPGASPPS